MISAAIRSILVRTAAITADTSTRVYPLTLPDGGTLPALIMQEVSHIQHYSLQHLSRVRVSILTQSTDSEYGYDIAHRIRDNVRESLMGYSGVESTIGVEDITHVGDIEMMEPEYNRFLIHSDYYVFWS